MITETEAFDYETPLQEGVAKITSGAVESSADSTLPSRLFEATANFAEAVIADLAQNQPPPKPLACQSGCNYCCSGFEVDVTPVEVLSISDFVSSRFHRAEIETLMSRLLATRKEKESYFPGNEPRPNYVCPLLKEGACSLYPVRPFICRGFNSYSAEACERFKVRRDPSATIEGYVHPIRVMQCALSGLLQGLAEAGLEGYLLDLTPALAIAMTTPEAKERWLAGEAVFEPARV